MDNNNIRIKNYELSFGDLGVQFKFNNNMTKSDIKNIMYYFEQYISQLDADNKLSKMLYDNSKKDFISIDDIQG